MCALNIEFPLLKDVADELLCGFSSDRDGSRQRDAFPLDEWETAAERVEACAVLVVCVVFEREIDAGSRLIGADEIVLLPHALIEVNAVD